MFMVYVLSVQTDEVAVRYGLVRVWEIGETRNETVTECLCFMFVCTD